ncbi:MAG: Flp family type IVb pilin [Candidatus Anammoximicrobium sp.]|nr:Flp family type IVb pilin [Candidatus Anammoximicrobium sp.]
MLKCVTKFVRGEEGATMVEYGLMLALIAVVCILAVTYIGTQASAMFTGVGAKITAPT